MRKAAKPNGHWISEFSVTKSSSKKFTVSMSPAKCGDNLPLFAVVGAEQSGNQDDMSFNFTEFSSEIRIEREQAASPPLTGMFDLSQLNKTVSGKSVLKVKPESSFRRAITVCGLRSKSVISSVGLEHGRTLTRIQTL